MIVNRMPTFATNRAESLDMIRTDLGYCRAIEKLCQAACEPYPKEIVQLHARTNFAISLARLSPDEYRMVLYGIN